MFLCTVLLSNWYLEGDRSLYSACNGKSIDDQQLPEAKGGQEEKEEHSSG